MSATTRDQLPVAVIGAGPVGLAAAAHLVERGIEPLVLEASAMVGANLLDFGHVQLFSPWRYNLSGPITIADYAGQSVQQGLGYYLGFLALVSVSLGVLNLLPLPMLDGGHLMYYLFEAVTGRPVSARRRALCAAPPRTTAVSRGAGRSRPAAPRGGRAAPPRCAPTTAPTPPGRRSARTLTGG